ncbi:MAG: hypothetical protein LUF90_05410 [Rikenellaceae bacterium]|nr:hypothetical protein [Rikenellaceae bacterium]
MISINDKIYAEVAVKLNEVLENQNSFFYGSIEFDTEQFYSTLTCTLILDRTEYGDKDKTFSKISKITPVWWEYSTYSEIGNENNDFSWTEFSGFL